MDLYDKEYNEELLQRFHELVEAQRDFHAAVNVILVFLRDNEDLEEHIVIAGQKAQSHAATFVNKN